MAKVGFVKNFIFHVNDLVKIALGNGSYQDLPVFQLNSAMNPYEIDVVANGGTVTISDQSAVVILKPAGTIAGATLNMPANPYDGQEVKIASTQTITTLTHNAGAGQTLNGALTTIGAAVSTHARYIYQLSTTTWFAI
jgi:hypothetical protein